MQRVARPHPGSQEKRQLGMPGGLDRLSPHALRQGVQWRWAPTFSERRDGVRPGRHAPQAGAPAPASRAQGFSSVVAREVEHCCAQVCQDRLMRRLAQQRAEKRVLQRIRASLPAGRLANGVTTVPEAGTPPGSPLVPCRSHVVWDAWAKELERRGPRGCRDADDSHSDVRSRRAGERGMARSSRCMTHRLQLQVHGQKRAVDRPQHRRFLGCSCTGGQSPARRNVASKALDRFTARVRALTKRHQGAAPAPRHHDAAAVSARMEGLLWLLPNAHGVAGCGQLDTPSSPLPPMATLEGVPATAGGTDQAGGGRIPGAHDRVEWQRSMGYQPDPRGTDRTGQPLL